MPESKPKGQQRSTAPPLPCMLGGKGKEMDLRGLRLKLRGIPILGGVAELVRIVASVYESIGWADPTYSVRTGRERLAEAQKIAATGGEAASEAEPELPAVGADEHDAGEGDGPAGEGNG